MKDLENDPEIKAAKRRLHMWLGTSTTLFAAVAIGFGFFLFSRFGISPWETIKLGLPMLVIVALFLLAAWWLSVFTARSAARERPADEARDEGTE